MCCRTPVGNSGRRAGVGVEVKRSFSNLEADTLLLSDKGEPTDDQEQNMGFPKEEGRGSIPSELLFSRWVKAFRTSCGYEFPGPMWGAKSTLSTNASPRPMKQRC